MTFLSWLNKLRPYYFHIKSRNQFTWCSGFLCSSLFFGSKEYPYLEAMVTARTAHGMLSLLPRHSKHRLALGTLDVFFIRLGLLNIAKAHILKGICHIGAAGSAEQAQKCLVFPAAHFNIAGKHAEKRVNKHDP